ncbi:50S ribosomal protein L9 [Ostreibacterium oceani]|uniref:Large ribosomal subunit protein bL9 n=1 Tax=Ostreibacterium oceani TaxID=2654998 RepID=A0A6N7EVM0_9GAMM|nr:50S ribosomal protein L9 [Ostreibacterium oceani]MPV85590.1 50S ribosomal protein L9 [Ostreibacterium oceani]
MQVILLEKIAKLGGLGDQVSVKPGYGRNYLIPKGKATPATPANIEKFEARRAELEKAAQALLDAAQAKADAVADKTIIIEAQQGGEGRLFGSVTSIDIVEKAAAMGLTIERNEIRMPTGPIRQTGEFIIPLHFHADVDAEITVQVIGID